MDHKEKYQSIVDRMSYKKKTKEFRNDLLEMVNSLILEIKADPFSKTLNEEELGNLYQLQYELKPIGIVGPWGELKETLIDKLKDRIGRLKVILLLAVLALISISIRHDNYIIIKYIYASINSDCKNEDMNFKINFQDDPKPLNNGLFHLEIGTPGELNPDYNIFLTAKNNDSIILKEISLHEKNKEFRGEINLNLKGQFELNFIQCKKKCNCNFLHSKTLSEFKKLSDQTKIISLQ